MLSAHGSAPEVVAAAQARGSYVVDSVCPLVTKVHHEVRGARRQGLPHRVRRPRGPRGGGRHDGRRPGGDQPGRVGRRGRRAAATFDEPVALLAQTTLSHRDWEDVAVAVRERYPDVWTPGRSDLCFATTNRQSALMALAERCDAIVVIGSANSSNTRALEKLALEAGCARVARVNDGRRAPRRADRPGPRRRASPPARRRPNELVDAGRSRGSRPTEASSWSSVTDEDEYFPPPRNLRELQAAIEVAATVDGRRLARPAGARSTTAPSAPATCSPPSPALTVISRARRRSPRRAARRRRPG